MFSNKLGRVDTKTGQIKEFPVEIAGSGPHGLINDKDGNIWFTANQ
jgi:virginiamycin B lyase